LWPVIDRIVPLQDAPAAYERLATGEQFGKLVIEVTQ
jgi:NADPH:quinone reductase-like Zn-dependent oxidoreductase